MMICDSCKEQAELLTSVFITTPDTFENRVKENYDARWCDACMLKNGKEPLGKILARLNKQKSPKKKRSD